jgi:hypothetical protein
MIDYPTSPTSGQAKLAQNAWIRVPFWTLAREQLSPLALRKVSLNEHNLSGSERRGSLYSQVPSPAENFIPGILVAHGGGSHAVFSNDGSEMAEGRSDDERARCLMV